MKIAMLASGGVDSSVALRLLLDQGHDVEAFYLKIWLEDDVSHLGECPWEEDLSYVQKVCEQANVKLTVINLQKEYWDRVVSYAITEVKEGRTPNPDMLCNARVKFDAFLEHIDDSYEKIASGHYADTEDKNGTVYLKRVRDQIKDQTYFLSHLSKKQMDRVLFPLGKLTKVEVRELAQKYDLPNKERKDSQGICFLGKIKYSDFIGHYLGKKPGDIIQIDTGEKIGTHEGFWFYTIGQRKGIGSGLNHGPWYVVKKDCEKNLVYISNEYEKHVAQRNTFTVGSVNWIGEKPSFDNLKVKIRHGKQVYNCSITEDESVLRVKIDGTDQGIAAGQFAVFYDEQYCYGGGVILDK